MIAGQRGADDVDAISGERRAPHTVPSLSVFLHATAVVFNSSSREDLLSPPPPAPLCTITSPYSSSSPSAAPPLPKSTTPRCRLGNDYQQLVCTINPNKFALI